MRLALITDKAKPLAPASFVWPDSVLALARTAWRRIARLNERPRTLRMRESLSLGERRFVAVIEYERERFLLGGTSASLVLLARLGPVPPVAETAATSNRPSDEVDES